MLIFDTNNIGQVVKLDDWKIAGTVRQELFSVAGDGSRLGRDFEAFNAIVTGVGINQSSNVQFQHTLGDEVYLNVFGDRISQMKVSGIAVAGSCGGGNIDTNHGFIKMLNFYRENKVSRRGVPLKVSLGSAAYEGFLVSFQGGMFGEQMAIQRFFQFSLDFVLPTDKNR